MRCLAALLLLGSCAPPVAAPMPAAPAAAASASDPARDSSERATARFSLLLEQPGRHTELELRRADGSAAMIWCDAGGGNLRGTTRLDLDAAQAAAEFRVDPAAELAVCLYLGVESLRTQVLLLAGRATRLRL